MKQELNKELVIIAILGVLIIALFTAAIISEASVPRVEGIVMSCTEGRFVKNNGAKAIAFQNFAKGKTTQALIYGNMSKMGTQMYDVVVEYEGNQYTIETTRWYEVGSAILFNLPTE